MEDKIPLFLRSDRTSIVKLSTGSDGRNDSGVQEDSPIDAIHEYIIGILLPLVAIYRRDDSIIYLRDL